jgi:hypothetical protein
LSHRYHPIAAVQLSSLNAAVIVINIVAFGSGGSIITIAVAVADAVADAVSTIAIVAVIVDVASSTLLHHHHRSHAPWQPIKGAGPNHTTETLPMACGWHPYPWIRRVGAGGVNMRTLCSQCCHVQNIMVFEQWKLGLRYPTVDGTYSYGKSRERKMRNCAGSFLSYAEQQLHRLTMTTKVLLYVGATRN